MEFVQNVHHHVRRVWELQLIVRSVMAQMRLNLSLMVYVTRIVLRTTHRSFRTIVALSAIKIAIYVAQKTRMNVLSVPNQMLVTKVNV